MYAAALAQADSVTPLVIVSAWQLLNRCADKAVQMGLLLDVCLVELSLQVGEVRQLGSRSRGEVIWERFRNEGITSVLRHFQFKNPYIYFFILLAILQDFCQSLFVSDDF